MTAPSRAIKGGFRPPLQLTPPRSKYPLTKLEALLLLAPQRALFAAIESKNKTTAKMTNGKVANAPGIVELDCLATKAQDGPISTSESY